MYKVKILLFLWGMEELAAELNALRQWRRWKGGSNEWKDRGNGKGLKECSPCSRLGFLIGRRLRFWKGRSVFVLGNGTVCVVDREFALKPGSCCVFWSYIAWQYGETVGELCPDIGLISWCSGRWADFYDFSLYRIFLFCSWRQCIHSFCRTLSSHVQSWRECHTAALGFVPFSYVQSAFLYVWNPDFRTGEWGDWRWQSSEAKNARFLHT